MCGSICQDLFLVHRRVAAFGDNVCAVFGRHNFIANNLPFAVAVLEKMKYASNLPLPFVYWICRSYLHCDALACSAWRLERHRRPVGTPESCLLSEEHSRPGVSAPQPCVSSPLLCFARRALKAGRRHRGVLTERQGQPCAPSAAGLPTIAQAPPGHHGRKCVSSDWLAVRLNPLAALRSHVSMTNLRGRVRAFPHSLPPRERNTWMDVGRLNIYLLRPRRAAGHWQRSQLLICRILYYLLGFVSFLFRRRLELERLLLEVDLRTKLI